MRDIRKQSSILKGNILAGYKVDEESVKEMLTLMGVNPTSEILQQAIGFLSIHSMEFNMSNLNEFLKSKNILSKKINVKDLRKKK